MFEYRKKVEDLLEFENPNEFYLVRILQKGSDVTDEFFVKRTDIEQVIYDACNSHNTESLVYSIKDIKDVNNGKLIAKYSFSKEIEDLYEIINEEILSFLSDKNYYRASFRIDFALNCYFDKVIYNNLIEKIQFFISKVQSWQQEFIYKKDMLDDLNSLLNSLLVLEYYESGDLLYV